MLVKIFVLFHKLTTHFPIYMSNRFLKPFMVAALVASAPQLSLAATDTYTDGTSGGLWNTAGNWSGGVPIATSGVVFTNSFANTVYLGTVPDLATSISFSGTAATTLLGGISGTPATSTLTLTGGVTTLAGSGTSTIGDTTNSAPVNLVLNGSQTFAAATGTTLVIANGVTGSATVPETLTFSNGGTVTFDGTIADGAGGALSISMGTGTFNFNGNNTFTGTLTANGTTLNVSGSNAAKFVNLTGGTLFTLNTGASFSEAAVSYGTNTANTVTVANAFIGTSSLTEAYANSLTIGASQSYSGASTVAYGGANLYVTGTGGALSGTTNIVATLGTFTDGDATNAVTNRLNTGATLSLGSGTFSFIRPTTAASSQTLAQLSVVGGSGKVTTAGNITATPTALTFGTYSRSAGGFVNFAPGSTTAAIVITTAPSAPNGIDGALSGAVFNGNDFATLSATNVLEAEATLAAETSNNLASGKFSTFSASSTATSTSTDGFVIAGGTTTVTLAGATTVDTGIIVSSAATSGTIAATGSLTTSQSGGDLWFYSNGKALTINAPLIDNGSSTVSFGGAAASAYTVNSAITTKGGLYISAPTFTLGSTGSIGNATTAVPITLIQGSATLNGTVLGGGAVTVDPAYGGTSTLTFANTATVGTLNGLGITIANGSGAVSFTQATGTTSTIGTLESNGSGTLTLTGSGNAVTTINLVESTGSGGVTINGTGTTSTSSVFSTTNIASFVGSTATSTINFGVAGDVYSVINLTGSGSSIGVFPSNLNIDGGIVNVLGDRFQNNGSLAGITDSMTGGTLNVGSTYGIRVGSPSGATFAGNPNFIATFNQSGGVVNISGGGVTLGSTSVETVNYNMSGGVLNITGQPIILDAANSGVSAFNLTGGKVLENGNISGSAAASGSPVQQFNWTGGTLAFATYTAANLTSSSNGVFTGSGQTVSFASQGAYGTLYNNGGVLAPGDIGTPGKSILTGNYVQNAGSLNIDVNGTTAAGAFQNSGAADYDVLAVSGTAVLGGALTVNLGGTYVPGGSDNLAVLTTAKSVGSLSGTFTSSNLETGKADSNGFTQFYYVSGTDGMSGLATVYAPGTASVAGGINLKYGTITTNTYNVASGNSWDAPKAASWFVFDPGSGIGSSATPSLTTSTGALATFGGNGSSATGTGLNSVTLSSNRDIQGISFNSSGTGPSYSISGTGIITLDNKFAEGTGGFINDSNSAGASNTIANTLEYNGPLTLSETSAGNTLTLSGNITPLSSAAALSASGSGSVVLGGNDSFTTATVGTGTTLQLGSGGTSGSLGSANTSVAVTAASSNFVVDESGTVTQGTNFGTISGNGNFYQIGTGTTILNANNTFGGSAFLNGGITQVTASGMLGSTTSPVTINFGGGELQYSGAVGTTDFSTLFSQAGNQAFNIDVNGLTVNYSGGLVGTGSSLTLQDSTATASTSVGVLNLNAAPNYTGPTTVNSGTLFINSGDLSYSSSVTVGTTASPKVAAIVLASGSTGTVGSTSSTTAVTVNNGGSLLFGASTGTNTINTVSAGTSLGGTLGFTNRSTVGTPSSLTSATPLTLQSGTTPIIDFGAGGSIASNNTNTLTFSSLVNLSAATALNIYDYVNSAAGYSSTSTTDNGTASDRLLFTSDPSGGTGAGATFSTISFFSGAGTGFLGTGLEVTDGPQFEIVPSSGAAPEPSTIFAGVCFLALLGYTNRRRLLQQLQIVNL